MEPIFLKLRLLLTLIMISAAAVYAQGGKRMRIASPEVSRTFQLNLNEEPPVEADPLGLYQKTLSAANLNHLWSLIPARVLFCVERVESVSLQDGSREALQAEVFLQLRRYQNQKSAVRLTPAMEADGSHGWTIAFPLRPSAQLKEYWKDGGQYESLLALVQVFTLKEHPYMYLLGLGRPAPFFQSNLYQSIRISGVAERISDFLRPVP